MSLKTRFLVVFFIVLSSKGFSQTASFTAQDSICVNEDLTITNTSIALDSGVWDFCFNSLSHEVSALDLGVFDQASNPEGITLIFDQGKWYGFLLGRDNNKILRLDFGFDPKNQNPLIVDLGNIGGLVSRPMQIKFLKEGVNWYAILANLTGNSLSRIDFGNSLSNIPSGGVDLGNLSSWNTIRGLDLVNDGSRTIAIITSWNNNKVTLLNFGNSIANIPNPATDILDILSGNSLINRPFGVGLCKQRDSKWYGMVSNFGNGKILHLEFGLNLFSEPNVNEIGSLATPKGLVLVREGFDYFGLIASSRINRIHFNDSLGFRNSLNFEVVDDKGLLNGVFGLSVVKNTPNHTLFTISQSTKKIGRIDFTDNCSQPTFTSSTDFEPKSIKYSSPGSYPIELTAFDEFGNYDIHEDTVVVKNTTAPTISYSTDNHCIENSNDFTGVSSDDPSITSWQWDFGDTNMALGQNATHQFDTAGVYDISLSIESDNGCTNQIKKPLRIYDKPQPAFSVANPTLCSNAELDFVNESQLFGADTLVSYSWNFNDEIYSSAQDTSVVFASGGTKLVTLSATIPGCSADSIKNVQVIDGPSVAYSYQGTCEDDLFKFTNLTTGNGITGYLWDFGDGNSSVLETPSHKYNSGGTYDVTLTASNVDGCNNILQSSLTVGHQPVPDFSYELPCSEQEIQFFDETFMAEANIASYDWMVQDSQDQGTSSEKNPLLLLGQSGVNNVSLKVVSTIGCADSITKSVDVLPSPTVVIDETVNCISDSSEFRSGSFLTGGGIISNTWFIQNKIFTEEVVKYPFIQPGDYDIMLTSRADNLCENTITETINIAPLPEVDFVTEGNCEHTDVLFTNLSTSPNDPINAFQWSMDNSIVSYNENFSSNGIPAGNHSVKLEVSTQRNCFNSRMKTLTINPAPTSKFTAFPAYGAPPMEVDFENESKNATSYLWDFSENNEDESTDINVGYTYQQIGTEVPKLIAYNEFNCTDTSQLNISIVNPVLEAAIQSITPSVVDDQIRFVVRIINNGTIILTDPQIKINFGRLFNTFETIPYSLLPGEVYAYQMSFQISSMPSKALSNICMELLTDGYGMEESNYRDNLDCVSFTDELNVITPYPNPVVDKINVPVMIPERSDVIVQLVAADGNLIREIKYSNLPRGLNLVELDMSAYSSGTYYIRIDAAGSSTTEKIVLK